jgi:hypothetical protein
MIRKRGQMNRKAQFYLIAAAIISVLLIGLATTVNYAMISPAPVRFYNIGEEYDLEASNLVNYGIYSSKITMNETIKNFTDQFYIISKQKDPDIELFTLYGNSEQAVFYNYANNYTKVIDSLNREHEFDPNTEIGIITLGGPEASKSVSNPTIHFWGLIQSPGDRVTIKISNTNYTVELGPNQNFYFVIMSRKSTGEVTVKTG